MSRWTFAALAVLFVALALPRPARSQEGQPQLLMVEYFDVEPQDAPRFEEATTGLVDAAGKAQLSSEHGWWTWTGDFEYVVVAAMDSFAELEDPNAWFDEYEGTPGEAPLMQAMEEYGQTDFSYRSEILQHELAWSYVPEAGMEEPARAEVVEQWVRPGKEQAYQKLLAGLSALFEKLEYPFEVQAYRTRVGEGRNTFVIHFESLADFEAAEEKLEASPEWQAFIQELVPLMKAYRSRFIEYRPELSYMPER